MKILWVAVVMSFVSVGQPAPLTCNELAEPVEKHPDLSGRWHYIAVSTEVCLPALLIHNLLQPSLAVDIAYKGTPNLYTATVKAKMYGFCVNETDDIFQDNNKVFEVNSENIPVGEPDVLLQTSCSDCIIVKSKEILSTVLLLSRRTTVTEEELKEFEMQVQCVRFSKPHVLNADHDHENCQAIDNITEAQTRTFLLQVIERVKRKCQGIRDHDAQTSPEQQQETKMWSSLQICCKADCYRTSFLPKTIRINDNSERRLSYGLKQ